MITKLRITLRFAALIFIFILGIIALMYVSDIFSGEYAKRLAIKVMKVVGIFTGMALASIFLTSPIEK